MVNVLLLGIEKKAAHKIESILRHAGHEVATGCLCNPFPSNPPADVVFLWGDHRDYRKTLAAIKARENAPPVILTTSLPDNSGWIDRCEEGVAGYCVAPFHAAHVLGTMDTVLGATGSRSRKTMAAKH